MTVPRDALGSDPTTGAATTTVIIVSPTSMRSSGATGVGPTTRVPFKNVPLELPRSSTVRPPAFAMRVACRREVRGSPKSSPSQSRPTSRSPRTTTLIGLRPG